MNPIRVHLGPMPEMLRTIIGDLLSGEPDIVIAGASPSGGECLRDARREKAEVVITQDRPHEMSTCLDLILAEPPLGVLAVTADGHGAAGVSLARRPITLETGSPSILADAIRRMAAALGTAPIEADVGAVSHDSDGT